MIFILKVRALSAVPVLPTGDIGSRLGRHEEGGGNFLSAYNCQTGFIQTHYQQRALTAVRRMSVLWFSAPGRSVRASGVLGPALPQCIVFICLIPPAVSLHFQDGLRVSGWSSSFSKHWRFSKSTFFGPGVHHPVHLRLPTLSQSLVELDFKTLQRFILRLPQSQRIL